MLKILKLFSLMIFICHYSGFTQPDKGAKEILVFYKTQGFHHKSVSTAKNTLQDFDKKYNFKITTTKDANHLLDGNNYDLIIFANTTGDVLDQEQQEAFKKYIEKGGSFFGIHSAAATEGDWPFFVELVGGFLDYHPEVQEADINVNAPSHPTVSHLPKVWTRTDEWYNFKDLNPNVQVLLYLDENSYEGGAHGKKHPIAWFRETDYGGISIYTALGHTIESYKEAAFKEHILQCILFALGESKK